MSEVIHRPNNDGLTPISYSNSKPNVRSLQVEVDELRNKDDEFAAQLAKKADNSLFFQPIKLPDYNEDGSININNIKVTNVYSFWDALITKYPTFFTKEILGKDQSGTYDLWKIVFNNPNTTNKKYKVLITANIHGHDQYGDAKAPAILVYEMVKNMIENNLTNATMQDFFYNYQFVIVPIANPWGFNNDKRTNSRGVDLNRNFNFEWDKDWNGSTDPTNYQYRGTSAASEAETKILQTLMNNNPDTDMMIDFHCFAFKGTYNNYQYVFYTNANTNGKTKTAANISFNYLSKKYNKNIVTADTGGGGTAAYAERVAKIPGITIEFEPFVKDEKPYNSYLMTSYLEMFVNYIATYKQTFPGGKSSEPAPIGRLFFSNQKKTITSTTYADIPEWKKSIIPEFDGMAVFHGYVSISSADINAGGVFVCPLLGQEGKTNTYTTPNTSAWENHASGGYRVNVPFEATIPVSKYVPIDVGMQFKVNAPGGTSGTCDIIKFRGMLEVLPKGTTAPVYLS